MKNTKQKPQKKRTTHKARKVQRQAPADAPSFFNRGALFLWLLTGLVALPPLIAPYGRSGGYTPDLHIAAWLQVFGFLILAIWLVRHIKNKFPAIPRSPVILPLSLLVFWALLSGFWVLSIYEYMMDAIEWGAAWVGGFLVILIVRNTRDIAFVMTGISLVGSLLALLGVAQYLFNLSIIEQVVVPAGTLANKNMYAQYLLMILPISLVLMVWSRNLPLSLHAGITAGMCAAVVMYTHTKSAVVALYIVWIVAALLWAYARLMHGYKPFASGGKKAILLVTVATAVGMSYLTPGMFKESVVRTQLEMEAEMARAALPEDIFAMSKESREKEIAKELVKARDESLAYVKSQQGRVPKPENMEDEPLERELHTLRDYVAYVMAWLEELLPDSYFNSATIRITMWVNSIPIFWERPLIGVGLGNWTNKYWLYQSWWRPDYKLWEGKYHANAHNDYVEIVSELGLVGLIFFAWVIFGYLRIVWRVVIRHWDERASPVLIGPTLGILALSICMLFSFPIKQPLTMFLCVVYLALLSVGYSNFVPNSVYGRGRLSDKTPAQTSVGAGDRIVLKGVLTGVVLVLFLTSLWWQHRMFQSEIYYRQASAMLKEQRFKESETLARQAYLLVPFRSALLWVRASALMSIGREQDAIPMFHEVLRSKPYSNSALHNLAVLYAQQDQPSKAADVLHDLVKTQQRLKMHELYGYYLYKAQRWEEALDQINSLIFQYRFRSEDFARKIARKEASPIAYETYLNEYKSIIKKYEAIIERKKYVEAILNNGGKIPTSDQTSGKSASQATPKQEDQATVTPAASGDAGQP